MSIRRIWNPTGKKQFMTGLCLALTICLWPVQANAQSVKDDIDVHVSVMDPKTVADVFGKRIAEQFVAIQVNVANLNDDYQFLLHDVSLDLSQVFPAGYFEQKVREECQVRIAECEKLRALTKSKEQCTCKTPSRYELSSLELSLLRGVAEKGQGQNRRNKYLRLFEGIGTVAAGLIGVASFGPSYAESVAVFNGPIISAYKNAFPDYTINQMNRLNDSAYQANTLVSKQHARIIVAFISQSIFLNKAQKKLFWDDPTRLFTGDQGTSPAVDFRRTIARVRGSFIVELENLPLSVTVVQLADDEVIHFEENKPTVKGYISGRFTPNTRINLLNQEPKGLSIRLDGEPSSDRLNFIIESTQAVPSDTLLTFEVSNDKSVQTISRRVRYKANLPTITDIDVTEGKPDSSVDIELTGTNFIPTEMRVLVTGKDIQVAPDSVKVQNGKLKATLTIGKEAKPGERRITVVNSSGESEQAAVFNVVAPAKKP